MRNWINTAKNCFVDKQSHQCEQMHEYYKYSDSELANIYVAGNVSDDFFMNTSEEMKRFLPERLKHRIEYEIENTMTLF